MFHGRAPVRDAPGAPARRTPEAARRDAEAPADLALPIARMGGRVEEMLSLALRSVARRDPAAARRVAEGDRELETLQRDIESRATALIGRRAQPPEELRALLAALRVADALDRIGALARNLAVRGAALGPPRPDDPGAAVLRLGERAQAQLAEALCAHQARDAERARAVVRRDAALDSLFASLTGDLAARMAAERDAVGPGAQWLFLAKDLERVGDHAGAVAAATWFLVTGEALDAAEG